MGGLRAAGRARRLPAAGAGRTEGKRRACPPACRGVGPPRRLLSGPAPPPASPPRPCPRATPPRPPRPRLGRRRSGGGRASGGRAGGRAVRAPRSGPRGSRAPCAAPASPAAATLTPRGGGLSAASGPGAHWLRTRAPCAAGAARDADWAGRRGPSSPERRALVWSRWPGLGLPPPGGETRGAHGQARGWGDAPRCAHPPPALNAPGQPSEEPRAPASAGEAPERQDLARAGDAVVETELPDARGTHFPLRSALESCQPGKASRRPRRFREVMVLALGSGGGIRTSPRRAADSQQEDVRWSCPSRKRQRFLQDGA
ncbi:translation initiation factor IF-2-like [Canis lupus familiaris]|uniref:translation initiation factor IF-2-like n=1 Tax=Canis lupus familiaris TaxID=9615 RepID=UPI0018F4D804|nr:translation initiation factor IF-2-like [Canis lupus familiaris]